MRINSSILRLYAVTDRRNAERDFTAKLEAALRGGVTLVQLREKNISEDEYLLRAAEAKKLCDRFGVPLIINDSVSVALRAGAAGVHVGREDMSASEVRKIIGKNMILGVTAKSVSQAEDAERAGADYLGCGAVFTSPTKPDAVALSVEELSAICRKVSIPVCAIGGINYENMAGLEKTGISGVAVVSGLFAADEVEAAAKRMRELSEKLFGGDGR